MLPVCSDGAYRFYLKTGAVIEGVSSYEQAEGEIKFLFMGGVIGLKNEDVLRIEEYTPGEDEKIKPEKAIPPEVEIKPPARGKDAFPPSPEGAGEVRIRYLKNRLDEIERELADIAFLEGKYKALKDEHDLVRLRIENLYKIGRENAVRAGRSPIQAQQQYLQFLTPAQRSQVQANFLRKRELEEKMKKFEETESLQALASQKESYLSEKAAIEEELKGLQSGKVF